MSDSLAPWPPDSTRPDHGVPPRIAAHRRYSRPLQPDHRSAPDRRFSQPRGPEITGNRRSPGGLRTSEGTRPGRHGGRVQGPAPPAGARGGAEDAPGRLLRRPATAAALPHRGRGRGRIAAPRHRPALRGRRARRRRRPAATVLHPGVRRGRQPATAAWPAGRYRRSRPLPGSITWPAPSTTPTSAASSTAT